MTGHQGAHAHTQGHHHTDLDWNVLGPLLEQGAELNGPVHRQAAEWLDGRTGRAVHRILDVGSGPGVVTCLLAELFPEAEVVAVDGTPELLERTRERAARLGLADRVTTRFAELPGDLGALGEADLIWSSKTVHHLGDQRGAVRELARLVRPGGVLALAEGGLPLNCLPYHTGLGRPGLLARLEVVNREMFAEMRESLPDSVETIDDWPAMLTEAGLDGATSRTFLLDLPAPLDLPARRWLLAELGHRREAAADLLADGDLVALDRLLDPGDPAGIMRRPDVFVLSAQTVHSAVRTG
ncbi:class I SAM-dependent methyltransferase [Streptomyces sp. NA02950]|uniref:class I SAM-dependent methyltransferase n=1 Tax=Streptomyces sp. NA02950 TaxID=2742137 RepID=UPI00158FD3F3|nr:class I SAM-dependent methyltransferase [Streptomyces sp. NA02950]QKV91817.1 class I SAM-dependent methyltransferase [Streptomyces sp. NA02950]